MGMTVFPNMAQVIAAREYLTDFLVHAQGFCRAVDRCEYVATISRFDMTHYVFKFRARGGPWYLAVCGGFKSAEDKEPGCFVGTDGSLYEEATAVQAAEALLDRMYVLTNRVNFEDMLPDLSVPMTQEETESLITDIMRKLSDAGIKADIFEVRQIIETLQRMEQGIDAAAPDNLPCRLSARVVFGAMPPDLRGIPNRLMHFTYPPQTFEETDEGLVMVFDRLKITISRGEKATEEEIRFYGARNEKAEDFIGDCFKNEATITLSATSEETDLAEISYMLAHAVKAALELPQALAVLTGSTLLSKAQYTDLVDDADYNRMQPLDAFVAVAPESDKPGAHLRTYGLEPFKFLELLSLDETDDELAEDMKDIAYDLVYDESLWIQEPDDHSKPWEFMRGNSGFTYKLADEKNSPFRTVRRTPYVWMDETQRIRDDLMMAGVALRDDAQMMNRMAFFLLWAYGHNLLRSDFMWEMDHEMMQRRYRNDLRRWLLEVSGSLDTRIFLKAGRCFVEEYYSMRHPTLGFYKELKEFAIARENNPRIVAHMQSVGPEAAVFLMWNQETFEQVADLLDRRYKEHRKRLREKKESEKR